MEKPYSIQKVNLVNSSNSEITPATEATLSSCDSTLTSIETDTTNMDSTLTTINGKITACDTGAVVVSSSALPSGASTSAKQPALGTAGSASSDVITVQGISSMTPVQVSNNKTLIGSRGNIQNGTLNAGSTSSAFDITSINKGYYVYSDTNTSSLDSILIEVSLDGTNYIDYTISYPLNNNASSLRQDFFFMNLEGFTYIRIKNLSGSDNYTDCNCSILGVN